MSDSLSVGCCRSIIVWLLVSVALYFVAVERKKTPAASPISFVKSVNCFSFVNQTSGYLQCVTQSQQRSIVGRQRSAVAGVEGLQQVRRLSAAT